jgi:hypothetical protein
MLVRPQWWKMSKRIDALFYSPLYAFAIYGFIRNRDWIRTRAIFYSGMVFTGLVVILREEVVCPHATPHLPLVLGLNLPCLLVSLLLIARVWKEHPFCGIIQR